MDLCFIDTNNRRQIKSLYAPYQFSVNVDTFNVKTVQKYLISVETLDQLLQIRLTDITDHSRIFICTIDSVKFNEIKIEQSLQVQFQGFIDHLIRILDSCKRSELFISLVQNGETYQLEFFEKRSFKNLIHLHLEIQEAPYQIILFYLNQSLAIVQDQVYSLSNQTKMLQNDVNQRDFHIQEQQAEIGMLKEKLEENENMILHRNTEEVKRLNQEIKNIESAKEFEENRLKTLVKTYEAKFDQQNQENHTLGEKLNHEMKKSESLKTEINRLKGNLTAMSSDNSRLQQKLSQYDASDKQCKMKITSLNQQVAELTDKIRSLEKNESDLIAQLEAEKQVCQTKKHALSIATDELVKNTESNKNHSKALESQQKKIDWRTLVLLRQEKDVKRLEGDNEKFQNIMSLLEIDHANYKDKYQEFHGTVQALKMGLDNLNEKYSKKINEIKDKVLQY